MLDGSIIAWLIPELSTSQWLSHIAAIVWSLLLIAFSSHLFALVDPKQEFTTRLKIFRSMNVSVILLHILDIAILGLQHDYGSFFANLGLSLITIYSAIYIYSVSCYFSYKRFGNEKQIDSHSIYLESYSTRIINLMLLVICSFAALYCIIKIWGADSLLQTTGIMGITVGFLALTSSIWGPDIISGLIILNSQILEDGDVVVIDGYPDEYIINKVSFIYVILYDIRNNHRTLIKNSRFLQSKIDNLSRIASTDGLRKKLIYNIAYPNTQGLDDQDRQVVLKEFLSKVDNLFQKTFDKCVEDKDIKINNFKNFEWALTHTGDYALEYTLWIFLDRLPGTKVTGTIRKHLIGSVYKVNEAVFKQSIIEGISLDTPILANLQQTQVTTAPKHHKLDAI